MIAHRSGRISIGGLSTIPRFQTRQQAARIADERQRIAVNLPRLLAVVGMGGQIAHLTIPEPRFHVGDQPLLPGDPQQIPEIDGIDPGRAVGLKLDLPPEHFDGDFIDELEVLNHPGDQRILNHRRLLAEPRTVADDGQPTVQQRNDVPLR